MTTTTLARRDARLTTAGIVGVDKATGAVKQHIPPSVVSHQHAPVPLPNGNVLAFDNVSGLPAWISDTLCRLASGGGFAVSPSAWKGRVPPERA